MFGRQEKGEGPEERIRRLEEQGLGGFAALVAEIESRKPKAAKLEERPGAQKACRKVSPEAMAEFESLFIKPGDSFEARVPRSAAPADNAPDEKKPVSFADAFRIGDVEPDRSELGKPTGGANSKRLETEAAVVSLRSAPAPQPVERPARPRPQNESRGVFDLGEFYDRIGLAREEAAALTRMLANDDSPTARPRSAAEQMQRLDGFLAELDIDIAEQAALEPIDPAEEARLRCAEASQRLAGLVEAFSYDETTPEQTLCGASGERLALLLDADLSEELALAAQATGKPVQDMILSALRAATQRSTLEDAQGDAATE